MLRVTVFIGLLTLAIVSYWSVRPTTVWMFGLEEKCVFLFSTQHVVKSALADLMTVSTGLLTKPASVRQQSARSLLPSDQQPPVVSSGRHRGRFC